MFLPLENLDCIWSQIIYRNLNFLSYIFRKEDNGSLHMCVNCTDKALDQALLILNTDPTVKETIQLIQLAKVCGLLLIPKV